MKKTKKPLVGTWYAVATLNRSHWIGEDRLVYSFAKAD